MNDLGHKRALYKLVWMEPRTDAAPFLETGDATETWIGSEDPAAIVRYVAGRIWPPRTALTLSLADPDALAPIASVTCGVAAIAAWSPDTDPLPSDDPSLSQARSRSTVGLTFMRDMTAAVRAAAADGLLSADEADGFILLVRDVVDRRRRQAAADGSDRAADGFRSG